MSILAIPRNRRHETISMPFIQSYKTKRDQDISIFLTNRPQFSMVYTLIECFHSRVQYLCKFIGTKESVCIRKEFNSQRIGLGHQNGRRFIVLGHQYGRRDVMLKHSIDHRSDVIKCSKLKWHHEPQASGFTAKF